MSTASDVPELDPETLAETLLDAASVGQFDSELARVQEMVDSSGDHLAPSDRFRLELLFFDLAIVSTDNATLQQRTAAGMLTGALIAGDEAWSALRGTSRLDEVERLARADPGRLELLELLAYAPEAGIRAFAVSQIQSAAMSALDSGDDSRSFERLLHGVGATDDAYRLEAARKHRRTTDVSPSGDRSEREERIDIRLLAIAGGHAQLRGTAASLLGRYGIQIVSIPSSQEAVRREREIVRLLRGCDLAMLLVRQITHSTSDQVRKAAERVGVPVVYSNALSAVAIERQLFDRKS